MRREALLSTAGVVLVALYLLPVYWMVATSLKLPGGIFAVPPELFPSPPTLEAFTGSVFTGGDVLRGLGNSTVIAVATTVVTLAVAVPAAYGLARLGLRYVAAFLLLFLTVQMVPSINLALPMFVIFSRAEMVNSYPGLVLANCSLAIPLAVTIVRPYFLSVPAEVLEAAQIDGCNRWTAFVRVALPVSVPGLITVTVISFLGAWGEFVFALALATDEKIQPITVVIAGLSNSFGTRWNELMAVSVVVAVPIIVAFCFLQRYVVGGLTAGASKE